MAMTPEQISKELGLAFNSYASQHYRVGSELGNRLAILWREASLAHMDPRDFDQIARLHMDIANTRMRAASNVFHPVAVEIKEAS